MGQRDDYLASDANWPASVNRDERLERWWSSASFGLALSGRAARAVAAADQAVAAAEAARDSVHRQAVYALLDEGDSMRKIASNLGWTKSRVGRIARRNAGEFSITAEGPHDTGQEARDLVLDAWQFPDLASSTDDHRRGDHDPPKDGQTTNFGRSNGP